MPPKSANGLSELWCASALAVVLGATIASGQTVVRSALVEAGAYLTAFSGEIAGVVLEERYVQLAVTDAEMRRELVSDLVVFPDERAGWVEFRDIFEVDSNPVGDREARLAPLFASPAADARSQARRIVQEGARYNLKPAGIEFERTLNLPLAPLLFLRSESQSRSRFRLESVDTALPGPPVTVVRFEEVDLPRLIWSPNNGPATGRFWIEQGTGRVLRSQLQMQVRRGGTHVAATLDVRYGLVPELALWLPGAMDEDYVITDAMERRVASVSGRATYSNVRRFRIQTEEKVSE